MHSILTLLAQSTAGTNSRAIIPLPTLTIASPLERLGLSPDIARWLERALAVGITLALTILALRLIPWLERKLIDNARKATAHGASEREIDLRQRVETLTRVVTSLARAGILSLAFVMILGELGFEIKPLLAGAGIAGVVIGFGSQSIVKDFFAGFFILLEDQYDVGDTITIGTVTGTVEQMTLRVTVVRDANGTAYFIPNSAIAQVANRTHGWARAAVDVTFQSRVRAGLVRSLLEEAAVYAKQQAPLSGDEGAVVKFEGPTEFDGGGTRWTLSVRAPASAMVTYRPVLIEALHHVLNEHNFEPDAQGRLGPN
jgi:small-conductance mechanosensitive channel